MSLWVPPGQQAHEHAAREREAAEYLRHVELESALRFWNQELQRIDPYLQLVKAREDTTLPGLKPGYFHVLRHNPGAPPSLIVHQGPNGEFREPDSGLFEQLRRGDLWNTAARKDREKKRRELKRAEAKAKDVEREARVEELAGRVKARFNPGVRITRSI